MCVTTGETLMKKSVWEKDTVHKNSAANPQTSRARHAVALHRDAYMQNTNTQSEYIIKVLSVLTLFRLENNHTESTTLFYMYYKSFVVLRNH